MRKIGASWIKISSAWRSLANRKLGIVSNDRQKIGSWRNQLQLQGGRVEDSDANWSKILGLALVKIFDAVKDIQFVSEESSELWLDGKSKVGRRQRIPVWPSGVGPNVKSPHQIVLVVLPALRHARQLPGAIAWV